MRVLEASSREESVAKRRLKNDDSRQKVLQEQTR